VTGTPDIIIIGHGTGDALQITAQAQQVLHRFGFAFAIGVAPLLSRLLTASGVELDHLDETMLALPDPADALLAAADIVFKQVEVEQPVVVLVPGNPLFLNSLSRFLIAEGGARGLAVQRLAGVSQLDVIVNELGIDVAGRGLQVFDAPSLVAGTSVLVPTVPVVVFRASELTTGTGERYAALLGQLGDAYPPDHAVTMFNIEPLDDRTSFASVPLAKAAELAEHLHIGSSLFIRPIAR